MTTYTVNNDPELQNLLKKILDKDKGAFIDYKSPIVYPLQVVSNIKIKKP